MRYFSSAQSGIVLVGLSGLIPGLNRGSLLADKINQHRVPILSSSEEKVADMFFVRRECESVRVPTKDQHSIANIQK